MEEYERMMNEKLKSLEHSYGFDENEVINIAAYIQAMWNMVKQNHDIIPCGYIGGVGEDEPILRKLDNKWHVYTIDISQVITEHSTHANIEDAILAFIKLVPFGYASKRVSNKELASDKNKLYMEYLDWAEYFEMLLNSNDRKRLTSAIHIVEKFMHKDGSLYREFEYYQQLYNQKHNTND